MGCCIQSYFSTIFASYSSICKGFEACDRPINGKLWQIYIVTISLIGSLQAIGALAEVCDEIGEASASFVEQLEPLLLKGRLLDSENCEFELQNPTVCN